jgi:hypothetical protein
MSTISHGWRYEYGPETTVARFSFALGLRDQYGAQLGKDMPPELVIQEYGAWLLARRQANKPVVDVTFTPCTMAGLDTTGSHLGNLGTMPALRVEGVVSWEESAHLIGELRLREVLTSLAKHLAAFTKQLAVRVVYGDRTHAIRYIPFND